LYSTNSPRDHARFNFRRAIREVPHKKSVSPVFSFDTSLAGNETGQPIAEKETGFRARNVRNAGATRREGKIPAGSRIFAGDSRGPRFARRRYTAIIFCAPVAQSWGK